MALCVPVSLVGAHAAKRLLNRILQRFFRTFVAAFLGLVAAKLLPWP